jgi:hypothetical protein
MMLRKVRHLVRKRYRWRLRYRFESIPVTQAETQPFRK